MADIETIDGYNADAYPQPVPPYKTGPELELRRMRKALSDIALLVKRLQVDLQYEPNRDLRGSAEFYLSEIMATLRAAK